jgi:hypothetical protein
MFHRCGEGVLVPLEYGISCRERYQHANSLYPILLRARCERPRRNAAEQGDEIAPSKPIELHLRPWPEGSA